MKKKLIYFAILLFIVACNLKPGSNGKSDNYDSAKTYKLQVNPVPGSHYHYDITNETTMNLEVDGKEIDNINKAEAGINYKISRDSNNGLLFTLQFDKIHLYSKSGDKIKEMDADHSELSSDPGIKLLKILKETTFQSTLNLNGEVKILSGFKDIGDKIIAAFPATDEATRTAIETTWNKTIGEKFVTQNTSQLFQFLPDTSVHGGSTWNDTSSISGDLPIAVNNVFTLKAINDDISIIECSGIISNTNSNSQMNINGIGNNVTSNLKGEQQIEYEIETKSGMLIRSRNKTSVTGSIQTMGREIPIKIKISVKIDGKKL